MASTTISVKRGHYLQQAALQQAAADTGKSCELWLLYRVTESRKRRGNYVPEFSALDHITDAETMETLKCLDFGSLSNLHAA